MNQLALNAFNASTSEINEKLVKLQKMADNNFGYAEDKINWPHAGTAKHVNEMLAEILAHFEG